MWAGDVSSLANGAADRYLLRQLIWCELCNRAMVPARLTGVRYYACNSPSCPRTLIPAEGIERLIWQQYCLLHEGTEVVVMTAMRQRALRQALNRVRVGEDMFEFWCEWKR